MTRSGSLIGGAASLVAALALVPAVSRAQQAPVPGDIPVALLVDLSSGQTLYAREADRRFVPASVTKVMTAYTAFKLIDEGKLSARARVPISERVAREWSGEGSSMFLRAGEKPTVGQLLLGSTTVSGNDATVALAIASTGSLERWTALMNENAAELGMADSHFASPNGFPDEGHTFTTARDLALLAEAITTRYPVLYERYFGHRQFTWQRRTQSNHDPITGRVDGADGLKTGFTNEAGYTFLGSAERDGRRLAMVIAAAPDSGTRNRTARNFMNWGFASFDTRPVLPAGALVGEALVQNGRSGSVMLRTANGVTASLPRGDMSRMTLAIRYRGPVEAPIAEGETIAFLRVDVDGLEPFEVPLEAAEDVAEANFVYRLVNGLAGLFA